ncbi:MAG: TolB family protein, partial [Pyrinomonadaceae bacterium]
MRGWEWGTHNGARVDPEGKRIIYSKMDEGSAAATMIRDIASGAETAFSLPLRHMRWSHDGRFIAGTDIPGRNWQLAEITVCAVDGETCRQLAKGSYPHWSHTDERIYFFPFTEFDGESLWVVSRESGDERRIMDLRPMHPISDFFDVSPQEQIVNLELRLSYANRSSFMLTEATLRHHLQSFGWCGGISPEPAAWRAKSGND